MHFEHCIISFLLSDPTHFVEQQVVLVKELSASSRGGEAPSIGDFDVDFVVVGLESREFIEDLERRRYLENEENNENDILFTYMIKNHI